MGMYFYPRGGSAVASRALAEQMERHGFDVTLVAGSRSDLGPIARADAFYAGRNVRPVDFTPALRSGQPLDFVAHPGSAPMHGSFEDRPHAVDVVLSSLDDYRLELQVEAWSGEFKEASMRGVDLLYLHHLTPLNEAAARALPDVPIVGHIHGTELLMLEAIEARARSGRSGSEVWAERLRRWAGDCDQLVVGSEKGALRAANLLGLPAKRIAVIPNGVAPAFRRRTIDRETVWRRAIGAVPCGTVFIYVGRFTAVKRLSVLIEAFAIARADAAGEASLVLVGGYPGEWEGEHPGETIDRLGVEGVHLAGWRSHAELPYLLNAADALVHAAVAEQFGLVLVEAMASGLPIVAVDRGGPSMLVKDGRTGWLVEDDDPTSLAEAMIDAIARPDERERRGWRASKTAVDHYAWSAIGEKVATLLRAVLPAGEAS